LRNIDRKSTGITKRLAIARSNYASAYYPIGGLRVAHIARMTRRLRTIRDRGPVRFHHDSGRGRAGRENEGSHRSHRHFVSSVESATCEMTVLEIRGASVIRSELWNCRAEMRAIANNEIAESESTCFRGLCEFSAPLGSFRRKETASDRGSMFRHELLQ